MDLETSFIAAFKVLAELFPDAGPVQQIYNGRKHIMPGDIASFLTELEQLKIYENLENFAVFTRFVADLGISLFKSTFLFSTQYQFKLSEDQQQTCYETFLKFAEMDKLLTDEYIAKKVFPDWERTLETEAMRLFRGGVESMETNFTDSKAGESYLLDIVNRVKSALGVRFALGLRNGTLTFLDAKERLEAEFAKNPFELDDTMGQNMLEAMFENDSIREGIEQVVPMLGNIPGLTGKRKKSVVKKLKSKNGERMIKDAMVNKQVGPSKQERTAMDIFLTIVIDRIASKFPEETRTAARNQIRRASKKFSTRIIIDATRMDGNFVKNATDLAVVTATNATKCAANVPGSNLAGNGPVTRKTARVYLQAVGYNKKELLIILNAAYGKLPLPNRGKANRSKTRKR